MTLTPRVRIGLRREVIILVPVSLILLVLLSTFTLFSYRSAISLLVDERRQQTLDMAVALAARIGGESRPTIGDALELSPGIVSLAILDAGGRTTFERGPATGAALPDGIEIERVTAPRVAGPTDGDGLITAVVPISRDANRRFLRVDVEARTLAGQESGLKILTWVVLSVNAGLVVLTMLFLRHLLTPIDQMIERARSLVPESRPIEDEMTFLVSSFERAVESLERDATQEGDELAALERTLGPNLESGMMLIGPNQEVLALNRAGAGILDAELSSPDLPLGELLGGRGDPLLAVIGESVATGQIVQRREAALDRKGTELTLGLSVNPLRRDDGSIRAFLVLFADLTETRRQAEEERVATSLAQVGELAAGVAHEMRNSLATFRGYLTLVQRSPDDDSIVDYLTELRRETDHLQRVLEDFLSFARPGTTRLLEIDLATIIRRAIVDPALEGLAVDLTPIRVRIKGDEQLLERAVRNLLHNAAESTAQAGSDDPVEVAMATEVDRVRITIADRGVGLPDDLRDRLFQPFVTSKDAGIGLGLALAHRIIDLHAGRLTLEDRAGGGAVATIELPLAG